MRKQSMNEERRQDTRDQESRQHERTGRFVLCAIYRGKLGNGVRSPGYLPSENRDRRPIVYVAPINAFKEKHQGRMVDDGNSGSDESSLRKWAQENVRPIVIDHEGMSGDEIMKDFLVRVPYPFWTATSGKLVPKAGLKSSWASVPSGETADDVSRRKMGDSKTPIPEKMKMAQARYGTPGNRTIGVPYSKKKEKYARPWERWF